MVHAAEAPWGLERGAARLLLLLLLGMAILPVPLLPLLLHLLLLLQLLDLLQQHRGAQPPTVGHGAQQGCQLGNA